MTTSSATATSAANRGRDLDWRQQVWLPGRGVGESPDIDRHQREDGNQIEDPLHHDGRERRGERQSVLPGHQVRPEKVANTRREDRERGKPDDASSEDRAKPCRTDRLEQLLPAERPNPERRGHEHQREEQKSWTRSPHVTPHVARGWRRAGTTRAGRLPESTPMPCEYVLSHGRRSTQYIRPIADEGRSSCVRLRRLRSVPVRCPLPRNTRAPRCSPSRNTVERPCSASAGQGTRHLRSRRLAADGGHRSNLGVRLRSWLGDSR